MVTRPARALRCPASTSTSSSWPLPETPAMPTISPAWTRMPKSGHRGHPEIVHAPTAPRRSSTAAPRARASWRVPVAFGGSSPTIMRAIASGVEVGDPPAAGEPPAPQHGHLVGELHHLPELVRDHEDGQAPVGDHPAQQAQHLVGLRRGQHRGRLVEDDDRAAEVELLQDLELLLLAGRQRVHGLAGVEAERHLLHEGGDTPSARPPSRTRTGARAATAPGSRRRSSRRPA